VEAFFVECLFGSRSVDWRYRSRRLLEMKVMRKKYVRRKWRNTCRTTRTLKASMQRIFDFVYLDLEQLRRRRPPWRMVLFSS